MFEYFPGNYRWSYNTLLALAAGGQLGDIDLIGPRLRESGGNDDQWHEEWTWLARLLEQRADDNLRIGGEISAKENLYLACLYHTIGEHFVPPESPVRLRAYDEVLRTFERARMLRPMSVERVEIPYGGCHLPAYFVPSQDSTGSSPAAIFICGLDTTKELSYLRVRDQLAIRGIHCLAIDTPGIGEPLRKHGMATQYDYELPMGVAINYLQSRKDVDSDRIGVIGSSLGGYYVARAAAFDSRIRAAVAWGVVYDYQEVWRRRIEQGGTLAAPGFQILYVTGTDSMDDALKHIENFKLAPIGDRITCPFLIVHGSEDQQVYPDHVEKMFDAIASDDKVLTIFDGKNGGAAHCQFDNHLPALQFIADWLSERLMR